MPITKLAHFSVRTLDLPASKRFYAELLGFHEGFRPPFKFPGVWLYRGGDVADFGVVHLIGIDKDDPSGLKEYLGDKGEAGLRGSGAVDHLAFLATDLAGMHGRLHQTGLEYRERTVPSLGLHQVFFEDPSGVTIELNFPAAEAEGLELRNATTEPISD
jgi:catechol 2,3-dioxygenase-like lactoylglutathione lyase family enzyme